MLPNFFVVGAQKCATTSLHHYLTEHPDVFLPDQKETKFFVEDRKYAQGMDYYESTFFSEWKSERAVGEVDPDYLYFDEALIRMHRHLDFSQIKWVVVFRQPVDRAFSHYLMTRRRGLEPLSFEDAVACEAGRIRSDYHSRMHFSYLSRGFYYQQITRLMEHVDRKNIFVLLTEELLNNPKKQLASLFEFLGVDTRFVPRNLDQQFHKSTLPKNMDLLSRIKHKHNTPEKRLLRWLIPWEGVRHKMRAALLEWNQTERHNVTLSKELRCRLSGLFETSNRNLEELFGCDLSHWND